MTKMRTRKSIPVGGKTGLHSHDSGLMFVQSGENRMTVIGALETVWAYETTLERQNGRWIIASLRVFPNSWDLDFKRLDRRKEYDMRFGTADEAARSARKLAHFVRAKPRPAQPAPVPLGGLTTRHIRKIPFGKGSGIASLTRLDAIVMKIGSAFRRREDLNRQQEILKRRLKVLRRGEGRLVQIASCYVRVLGEGSHRLNVDVARQLNLKVSQVRDAICSARRKGLLSATDKQGVPGGTLTPKAIALLNGLTRTIATAEDSSKRSTRR